MWLLRHLITGLVALALPGGVGYGLWVTGEQIYLRFLGRRVRATIVDYEMHSRWSVSCNAAEGSRRPHT
jgi:hypothetical protein